MEGEGSCSEGGDEAIIDYPRTKEKGRSTLDIILCCVSTPRCVPPNLGSIRSHSHHELYPSRLNLVHKFHKILTAMHASCSVSEARRKGCCLSPKLFSLSLFLQHGGKSETRRGTSRSTIFWILCHVAASGAVVGQDLVTTTTLKLKTGRTAKHAAGHGPNIDVPICHSAERTKVL